MKKIYNIFFSKNPNNLVKNSFQAPDLVLFAMIGVAIYIGFHTAQDYGLSWDELGIHEYSIEAISAYQDIARPWEYKSQISDHLINLYGPSHFMLSTKFAQLINYLSQDWSVAEGKHYFYFLTFLFCLPSLYNICVRYSSKWASLFATILFATQPLIWGNAFINPKDIPFMSFYIISIDFGFRMIDNLPNKKSRLQYALLAGIFLGVTTSIRSIAPMIGVFFVLFGLWKFPQYVVKVFAMYFVSSIITTYFLWPYLWEAPINHLFESVLVMSKHPMGFPVLFAGKLYPANNMPVAYAPTLITLQLTASSLIVIVIGFYASVFKEKNKELFMLFLFWFFIPLFAIVSMSSTLYDNARQLLFIVPALFVFTSVGFNAISHALEKPIFKAVIAIILITPGVYASIQLHPYQYIFYNQLSGGVVNAFRNYDLDYSGTSFKEAMLFINRNSEPNTDTYVLVGPRHLASVYARQSLKTHILGEQDTVNQNGSDYYYVLFLTRGNADLDICNNGDIVFFIERNGGTLSYVRKIYSKEPCWKQ